MSTLPLVLDAAPEYCSINMPPENGSAGGAQRIRLYVLAMLCQAGNKGIQMLHDLSRASVANLSGVELSGILNSSTQTIFKGMVTVSSPYMFVPEPFRIPAAEVSLRQTVDRLFVVPIATLTYISVAIWLITHMFAPCLQRALLAKRDVFMRRILEEQNNSESEVSPQSNIANPMTRTDRINHTLDYIIPVALTGSQIALGLRALEKVAGYFFISGGTSEDFSLGGYNMDISMNGARVDSSFGAAPVSDAILWLFLVIGCSCYLAQAVNNFLHDLQTKKNELLSPV